MEWAPVHPCLHPGPEFLRARGVFRSPTMGVYLKIGNQCAQGLQRPHPPPLLLQTEAADSQPSDKGAISSH